MSTTITADQHAAMVAEVVVVTDASEFEAMEGIKNDRKALAEKILGMLLNSSFAKEKGFKTTASLKEALRPTAKDANVKGAQQMILDTIGAPEPPAMLGVLWTL